MYHPLILEAEEELQERFKELDSIYEYNQEKVLRAMQGEKLASTDFNWTTGYGYGDVGREKTERIYAKVFQTENALVRPTIVSGTHSISLVLKALTNYGDEILSITGSPYDTLQTVIGITEDKTHSLIERGRKYREIPLLHGKIQYEKLSKEIRPETRLIILQRSTGYSDRNAFTVDEIARAVEIIRSESAYNGPIFLDNCYGEFTQYHEATEFGVDIMAGSLIKNPGGGLAYSGGYIVGRESLIERVAAELTAPGIGKECGLTYGQTRNILMGLFLAPQVAHESMKGALLFSRVFENLGFDCIPKSKDTRSDIIQSIALKTPEGLISFCKSIQASSPVDSHVTPYPWDMPGYEDPVIMAAGGFVEGSSIELSADGPLRPPYRVYFQGGLTYAHCKIALNQVLEDMKF